MLDAGGFDSLIGRSFNGYRVTRFVARGGMGMVFEGIQESLNRPVAIKFLYPHLSDNEGLRDRFQREALAAARLNHPNIVRIIDFGVDGLLFYMVMDFVAGESLRELLVREHGAGRVLPRETTVRVLRQIGSALTHAHALGLVHRDVKPSNILLTPDGRAFLTDFGVVKILGESQLTATGMLVGTPEYMAPEQASGETEIGPAADLYSFAVVAYEMLVGRVPFQAPTPHAVIRMHLSAPPPAPSTLLPDFSPGVEAVLMRALAKDPGERYPTVDAFVDDLIGALGQSEPGSGLLRGDPAAPTVTQAVAERTTSGVPTVPVSPGPVPTSPPEPASATIGGRRRLMLGAGIGAVALVLAVGGLLAAGNHHTAGPPTPSPAPTVALAGTSVPAAGPPTPTATSTQYAGAAPTEAPTPTPAPTAVPSPTAGQYGAAASATAAPSSANQVVATIKVGANPQSVAADDRAVWVTNVNDNSVSRIDPQTNKVVAVVSLAAASSYGTAASPSDVALGPTAVWVAEGGAVVRIDPATNQVAATIAAGTSIGRVLVADGSVWASDFGAGMVYRIDPQGNKIVARIAVGKRPLKLAATSDAIWVNDTLSNNVYRIDPNTNQVTGSRQVGDTSAGDLASGADSVWVVTYQRLTVYRVTVASDRIQATIPLTQETVEVATGFGAVWVTTAGNQVVRIDPQTNAVVASIPCGANPLGVAAGAGSIWVVDARDNAVARIQP